MPYLPPYQPYYCEENVWQLCRAEALATGPRHALFISNTARTVVLWEQRAAPPGQPIVWDYHVVMVSEASPWLVWDPDCRLGLPLPAPTWLDRTFGDQTQLAPSYRARFRLVDAARYVAGLSSDRSHMRDAAGRWMQPPPQWDPPSSGPPNLMRYVDMDRAFDGRVLDLSGLRRRMVVCVP